MKKKLLVFILLILFYGKTSLVLAQTLPTPTPTPNYYATPTPTPTINPTATPTPIATQSAAPVTANFTPTLFVFGAGILLMMMGLLVIL